MKCKKQSLRDQSMIMNIYIDAYGSANIHTALAQETRSYPGALDSICLDSSRVG